MKYLLIIAMIATLTTPVAHAALGYVSPTNKSNTSGTKSELAWKFLAIEKVLILQSKTDKAGDNKEFGEEYLKIVELIIAGDMVNARKKVEIIYVQLDNRNLISTSSKQTGKASGVFYRSTM